MKETYNIILDKLFPHNDNIFEGFTSDLFSKSLDNCTKGNFFLFDQQLYAERDGAAMGGYISPNLANILLTHHEEKRLNNYLLEFKPIMYRRYVDGTFLLFSDSSHVLPFRRYLNNQHNRIEFTSEAEINNSLNFLVVKINKKNSEFPSNLYRKPTFSGLGLK